MTFEQSIQRFSHRFADRGTELISSGAAEVLMTQSFEEQVSREPDAHVVGQMLRRAQSDLIVTGIPRHSRWQSLVHGDGAEKLRQVASCPVLNVPEEALEDYANEVCT